MQAGALACPDRTNDRALFLKTSAGLSFTVAARRQRAWQVLRPGNEMAGQAAGANRLRFAHVPQLSRYAGLAFPGCPG